MATLTMEQDTDMKRFIEDRKQRYYDNDKAAVFATSLPLSNNGVEDRRSQLRDERHRDYQRYLERFGQQYQKAGDEHIENPFLPPPGAMPKSPAKREVQQQRMDRKYDQKYDQILQETEQSPANSQQSSANSKQSSTKQAVYYRMDSPERGLPLGNYDLVKEKLSQERHQDYKNYLKKKHQDESERNRTRYSPSRPQVPPQPRPGDIDYSQMKQELADERKRDYQDYLGKKYIAASEHPYKQPIDYKQQRLFLAEERRHEYNEYLNKKGKAEREFALKGRVPTPPGGLDIGQYDQERKALGAARKQEYRELLDKQQQEHMYVRAQQENGIPVLDRTPREEISYVTSKPPPGPGAYRQRDEPTRQTPHYWDEGRPVRSPQSYDSQPGQRNDPVEHAPQLQAPQGAPPAQHSPRRTPLALQTGYRPSTPSDPRRGKPPPNLDFPYGYGYEEMRKKAVGERHKDYQEYVKRESEKYRPHADELPPPGPSDFPKGHHYNSDEYEKYRKDLQQKQHAEYQDFLQKKYDPPKDAIGLPIGQYRYEPKRLAMEAERNKEYNELQKNKESVKLSENSQGLPIGPYRYRDKIHQMESQRNKEYNEYLQKKQYNELLKKRRDTTMGDLGSSPRLTEQDDVVPFLRHQREIEYKKTTEEQNRPKNKEDPTYGKSLPLGQFDELRPLFEKQRNRDYREHLKKLEQKSRAVTPLELSGLPIGQHNYDTINKAMETQRNREYNEFLEKLEKEKTKSPRNPEYISGLPIGQYQYHAKDKFFEAQRNQEYNEYLRQHEKSDVDKKRPSVHGGGLPIGPYRYNDIQKLQELERNKEYNEFLKKKYRQPDTTRSNQQPTSFYMGDDSVHEDKKWQMRKERNYEYNKMLSERQQKGRPRSVPITFEELLGFPIGQNQQYEKRTFLAKERNKEYNQFLKAKNQQAPDRTWKDLGDNAQGLILGDSKHENQKKLLNDERRREYNEHLAQAKQFHFHREKSLPQLASAETPIISHMGSYDSQKMHLKEERHKDLVAHIEKKNRSYHSPYENFMYPTVAHAERPLVENLGSNYEEERRKLAEERKRDFELYLEKKQMSDPPRFGRNTPPVVGPYSGIFAGLGQYDLDKQRLKKERQSEYSNYLDKTYAEKGRPYGRPTWAKDIDDSEQYPARPYSYEHRSNPETKPRDHLPPIQGQGQGDRRPPSYEDMLAKKRQNEADRRRYDPGFAPRDDRYEAERNGPARDGDYAPRDGGYGGDGNQGQDQYRY